MPYPCKRTNERILISILLAKDVKPALFSRQVDELTDALVAGVKRHSRGCLLIQMRDSSKVLGPLAQDACDVVFSQFCAGIKQWLESAARCGVETLKTDSLTTTHLFLGLITLIRNGFRDGLDEAGIRKLSSAHVLVYLS